MNLILASSSISRAKALTQLGLSFTVEIPDIDERPLPGEAPEALVERLSREKAQRFSEKALDALWIGSDQVMVLGDQVLGKPRDHAHAVKQLTACSGQEVQALTGLYVLHPASGRHCCALDRTVLHFRALHFSEIEHYLAIQQPYQCCGSVQIEGLGISLFEAIDSHDPSALLGIPLISLCTFLRYFNAKEGSAF